MLLFLNEFRLNEHTTNDYIFNIYMLVLKIASLVQNGLVVCIYFIAIVGVVALLVALVVIDGEEYVFVVVFFSLQQYSNITTIDYSVIVCAFCFSSSI